MAKGKQCKDCREQGIASKRKAAYPGPRCFTHHKQVMRERKDAQHARHIGNVYGITSQEYEALYQAQSGVCYICGRANGRTRKLAVDHDHSTGFVRGLLCGAGCNRGVLGHLRDDPAALQRAIDYLNNPPAFAVIGHRSVPFDGE